MNSISSQKSQNIEFYGKSRLAEELEIDIYRNTRDARSIFDQFAVYQDAFQKIIDYFALHKEPMQKIKNGYDSIIEKLKKEQNSYRTKRLIVQKSQTQLNFMISNEQKKYRNKKEHIENVINISKTSIEEINAENKSLGEQVKDLSSLNQNIEASLIQGKHNLEEIKSNLENARVRLKEAKERVKKKEEEKESLKGEIEKNSEEIIVSLDLINKERDELNALEKEAKEVEKPLKKQEDKVEQKLAIKAGLESDLESLRNETKELEAEQERLQRELIDIATAIARASDPTAPVSTTWQKHLATAEEAIDRLLSAL